MKKHNLLFWCTLICTMILKYGYYGFTYFPVVDDHNMYGIFSMLSPAQVLSHYRMYTTRPLAALLDTYIISRLWGNLWMILLLFTVLHFFCCYFIYLILMKNNIKTGTILAITFALLPLGVNASYWIAASSRIVAGLFFALLSFFLYMQYIEKSNRQERKAPIYLIGFAVTNLISLGFYEQVIAFSFIGGMLLIVVNFKRLKSKWVSLIPVVNIAIIGFYYFWFRDTGNMANRGQLLSGSYIQHTIEVFDKIRELTINVPASMIKHGTINGAQLLLSDRAVVFSLLAVIVSILFGIFFAHEKLTTIWKGLIIKVVVGFALVILPFAPFFVLQTTWIVHRNAFISIIGVGLIAEGGAGILFSKWDLKVFRGIVAGMVVFVFLLCNVAEVNDYRNVAEMDSKITANMAVALEEAAGQEWINRDIVVFNTKKLYVSTTSRHLSNCTGVNWALAGAMCSILRLNAPLSVETVATGMTMAISRERLEECVFVGMDSEGRSFPLIGEWRSIPELELRRTDGAVFGEVEVLDNNAMIKFTLTTEHTG